MTGRKHLALGVFVVSVVALLGYYTVFLRDFSLFKERQHLRVHFESARGLRVGDPVLVAGVRWGRIERIEYRPRADPKSRVEILLRLDQPVELYQDAALRIEDATVLGGRQVSIDPGRAENPPLDVSGPLTGSVAGSPLDSLGEFVRDNRDAVGKIVDDLRELVAGARAGRGVVGGLLVDDRLREDLASTLDGAARSAQNIARISDGLAAGTGTLGKLLVEETIYARLSEIGDSLAALAVDAREVLAAARGTEGLVGRVLNDRELADDASTAVKRVREILDGIRNGEGTLGALVREDGIARRAEEVLTRLSNGQGTLGRLLSDDEVYVDLKSISSDLAAVLAQVRSGQGTLGRLFMEDELYGEIAKAIGLLTRSLEEYREAAPISTMTSVLFGAF